MTDVTSAMGKSHVNMDGISFYDSLGNRLFTVRNLQSPTLPQDSSGPTWTHDFGFVNSYYNSASRVVLNSPRCITPQIIDQG